MLAPVIIFAYNRPDHLQNCLNSLFSNSEAKLSKFFVVIDGPKNEYDKIVQAKIVNLLEDAKSNFNLQYDLKSVNLGLANSIIRGLNQIFEKFDSAIILEDDLEVSQFFLKFCNDGLNEYKSNLSVASIQGFSYKIKNPLSSPYFLRGADCWGWATWRDRWLLFDSDAEKLLNEIKLQKLNKLFDLNGAFPYSKMLERQSRGEIDSWAIRWHASIFLKNMLSLYPNQTLVKNNGFDGSGTHTGKNKGFESNFPQDAIVIENIEICASKDALFQIQNFLRTYYSTYSKFSLIGIKRRILSKFQSSNS
jgi:hypothetical protein